jgi:NAD(P)-dependent dehydrogenase (short-subunit alcohol dehydrogenase family)
LHALFPYKFVLHVHPALVNGLTCVKEGAALSKQLFKDIAVWVELTKPGYILAATCHHLFEDSHKKTGEYPKVAILQNHGLFVAADTTEEIDQIMENIMDTLTKVVANSSHFAPIPFDEERATKLLPALRMLYSKEGKSIAGFCTNNEVMDFVSHKEKFSKLVKPFTPDHIVYCKDEPLFIEEDECLIRDFEEYHNRKGYSPKIVAIKNLGFIALGASKKESDIATLLFLDAIRIARYGESFGELLPMTEEMTEFILTWEMEQYRSQRAFTSDISKRLDGKIALVTGAAQGFGKGIASELVKEGATVVIADINLHGAKDCSKELNAIYGKFSTLPLQVDVTDESSVSSMITETVLTFGGLDLLISNAGVLVAGDIFEMTKKDFDFVTAVNYTGYFLCAKNAAPIMKIQHDTVPGYLSDIIEINSKSGLEGSNKNFAYAGSKFGGVGLTQSFALEFIEYGIKVNAICPGNLLDGPLWSDPEKGLFKQYLDAGKVKGATTIEDVRRFYESRVPMGRGCETLDVARAIFYIVEQQYETGQAIPVTGGQVMLS